MRIGLKSLFLLTAIAAAISCWLATRQTPQYSVALVQLVDPLPGAARASSEREAEFADAFYRLLLEELASQHSKVLERMHEPRRELRQAIRLKIVGQSNHTTLVSFETWGNSFTSSPAELNELTQAAVRSLRSLPKKSSLHSTMKILNLPAM
ncbi:MAG: hypothetical protein ACTHK7_20450 [Aureliella sp.]